MAGRARGYKVLQGGGATARELDLAWGYGGAAASRQGWGGHPVKCGDSEASLGPPGSGLEAGTGRSSSQPEHQGHQCEWRGLRSGMNGGGHGAGLGEKGEGQKGLGGVTQEERDVSNVTSRPELEDSVTNQK